MNIFRRRHPEAGAPPGTLVFQGDRIPARVQMTHYSPQRHDSAEVSTIDEIVDPVEGEFMWIDIAGINDPEILRAGGKRFGLSELAMEAIVNIPQRPKTEMLDGQLLTIARILNLDETGELKMDQLSVVLGPNYVITLHNQRSGFFDPIRRRLASADSRMRSSGPDYLAYAAIDIVVDGYYPVLEKLGEQLESLESKTLQNAQPEVLNDIHRLRSQLLQVRRIGWPMRETIDVLLKTDSPLVHDSTDSFLRDVQSHCSQIVDVVEMYRESSGALVSTYMSAVAHRSNEIMKVLTMVSSVFVPLTFIAGIYGMNFEHMPELSFKWSYPIALMAMALTATGMVAFFVFRGWFGNMGISGETVRTDVQEQVPNQESKAIVFKPDSRALNRRQIWKMKSKAA